MSQGQGNWWTRECGGREVVAVALPLVISTTSFTIMHFCDRMFLAWFSTDAMAAALPAGMLNWTIFSLPMGVAAYANTFVAQYHGAGRPERIGAVIWQAMRIGLYTTPLFLAIALLAPHLFRAFGHAEDILWLEVIYYQVLTLGAGGVVMAAALSSFFIGRGKTRVIMVVNMIAAVLNILLDWVLIFGHFGLPALGIEGAAWATVVSQWFKVAAYWWMMHHGDNPARYQLSAGRRLDLPLLGRMFRYGGPSGLQFAIEGAALVVFCLVVGQLGKTAMAATTLAFSVNMVAFVPVIGLGIAVSTLVGQQIGRGRPELASRATWTACGMALAYTVMFAFLYFFAPDFCMAAHAAHSENFGQVRDTVIVLLRFAAAYCLFDALQIVFSSAIKGAGDTAFILATTAVMSTLFVAIGTLGTKYGHWGLLGWWVLLTGWICLLALIYSARFLQGRWRRMSVIEPELIEPAKAFSLHRQPETALRSEEA